MIRWLLHPSFGPARQAQGVLSIFDDSLGNAAFVSHQWVDTKHPDPHFKQMQVLQDALRRILTTKGRISLDIVTEAMVHSVRSMSFQELQARPLFLWYDYFSIPQLQTAETPLDVLGNLQEGAISSIAAYVGKCRYFFALCPVLESPFRETVLSNTSWAKRGWCRLERAARELSEHHTWILVQSSTSIELVGTAYSFVNGSVGEGEFGVEGDKAKLAPVMKTIVKQKLRMSLQAGDLPSYRRHLNLQSVHLRGLDVEPLTGIPNPEPDLCGADDVSLFFYQNGLTSVTRRDAAGWLPLHYAALSGNVPLIEGLLLRRADPNSRTSRDEPTQGFDRMTAVDLALFYRHNDAAQRLITARAHVSGGSALSIMFCAGTDNVEGTRLLYKHGSNLDAKMAFGHSALEIASAFGSLVVVEEFARQAPLSPSLSLALRACMMHRGGSAEMVDLLIGLRADVNFQCDVRRDLSLPGRIVYEAKSLQHRFSQATAFSAICYHMHGATPLMFALQTGQYEGAAALITAGARLDLKNCRGWTAADFARGQSLPDFLQQALDGDLSGCKTVSSLALPDGWVEVAF